MRPGADYSTRSLLSKQFCRNRRLAFAARNAVPHVLCCKVDACAQLQRWMQLWSDQRWSGSERVRSPSDL